MPINWKVIWINFLPLRGIDFALVVHCSGFHNLCRTKGRLQVESEPENCNKRAKKNRSREKGRTEWSHRKFSPIFPHRPSNWAN